MLTKIWDFLNGKKTVFGLSLIVLGKVTAALPFVLALVGLPAAQVTVVVGVAATVVGVGHKVYKFLYKEEAPKE